MKEIELEKTYLAKYVPDGVWESRCKEIVDLYIPVSVEHPLLRIRKKGDAYEMTKKQPVSDMDASTHSEDTIALSEAEFDALSRVESRRVRKIRYYFEHEDVVAEFDIFQDALDGLVVVDFEFDTVENMEAFHAPDFCLVDVTQEEFIAGGMLCGKTYADIEDDLARFGYEKRTFQRS